MHDDNEVMEVFRLSNVVVLHQDKLFNAMNIAYLFSALDTPV